jgi:uncharacterized protein with HEPN domain
MGEAGTTLIELLQSMIAWGERSARVIGVKPQSDFMKDEIVQLATQKCIEAIGECANKILKLHPDFADENPDLELKEVYRMRNRLGHGYDSVNLTTVWNSAREDVPHLTSRARAALEKLGAGNDESEVIR